MWRHCVVPALRGQLLRGLRSTPVCMTLLYASMEGVGWAVQGPSAWGVASHVSCITPERRHLPSGSSDCKAQAQHASPPSTQEWTQSEAGEQSEARGEASDAATRTRGTCNDVSASPFQGLPAQEVSVPLERTLEPISLSKPPHELLSTLASSIITPGDFLSRPIDATNSPCQPRARPKCRWVLREPHVFSRMVSLSP